MAGGEGSDCEGWGIRKIRGQIERWSITLVLFVHIWKIMVLVFEFFEIVRRSLKQAKQFLKAFVIIFFLGWEGLYGTPRLGDTLP